MPINSSLMAFPPEGGVMGFCAETPMAATTVKAAKEIRFIMFVVLVI
jgi:hypothetical protein